MMSKSRLYSDGREIWYRGGGGNTCTYAAAPDMLSPPPFPKADPAPHSRVPLAQAETLDPTSLNEAISTKWEIPSVQTHPQPRTFLKMEMRDVEDSRRKGQMPPRTQTLVALLPLAHRTRVTHRAYHYSSVGPRASHPPSPPPRQLKFHRKIDRPIPTQHRTSPRTARRTSPRLHILTPPHPHALSREPQQPGTARQGPSLLVRPTAAHRCDVSSRISVYGQKRTVYTDSNVQCIRTERDVYIIYMK
jgi:hypothetical protein